ncbi:MAG: hypothetical protein HON70_14705, partial [Lentisphaerae bacterium]|nr:hypothetical protein [Lentisphaerota bacterium]
MAMSSVKPGRQQTVEIPGLPDPLSLRLSAPIQRLRDKALELHRGPQHGIPARTLADARTWATRVEDEDWLIWRARRCAERLRTLPFDIEPGECIIGKPEFRAADAGEAAEMEQVKGVLDAIPPFPGGDAGHFHPDYERIFTIGVQGVLDLIRTKHADAGLTDEQRTFYDACRIVMEGLSLFIQRAGGACAEIAAADDANGTHWRDLADICDRVSTAPPQTFHEALQLMFLTEIALWFGEDHGLTCPGRMDQTLWRFYEADREAGRITPERAFEMICCLYVHLNRILWPGSAVAVMVGGRDRDGQNVTNELTYLCLAARQATQLVYPTLGLAWHRDIPDELMDFSVQMLTSGVGDPAFFNDELIADGLRDHGVQERDVHNFMNSTCVEIKVVGTSNMWVTQPYINCPQALLDVMGKVGGGEESEPADYAELCSRVQARLSALIGGAAKRLDDVWQARAERGCFPLASCFIDDCLDRGADFDRGGARYNWVENAFVGLANLGDSLVAVRDLVYGEEELTLGEFQTILEGDYEGHEPLRQRITNSTPSYGNDDADADELLVEWANFLNDETEAYTVGAHRYVPGFFCWIQHERLGAQTGATPDGRQAGWPLADGAGAAQGRERNGPTAAVLSTTKWSHRKALGGLVHNIKFSDSVAGTVGGRKAIRHAVETFLLRGGFEIQVNVVGKETLLKAQESPELYPD